MITVGALACLGFVLIVGLAAPEVVSLLGLKGPSVRDPTAVNLFGNPTGPGANHPLGVDGEGRDVLSRILYGLRSLLLISLAGTAAALVAGVAVQRLAELNRWLALVLDRLGAAVEAFPVTLLGLGLGLALGPGVWRLITVIGLTQIVTARPLRRTPAVGVLVWANAVALDFALTFLGDGPGGRSPQLGAMVARAGLGILAGVPAWWALVFPGLAVTLVLIAARALAPAPAAPDTRPAPDTGPAAPLRGRRRVIGRGGARVGYVADQLTVAVLGVLLVGGLAALMFRSLGDPGHGAHRALAPVGADLSATVSVLAGGGVVWLALVLAQVWLATRPRRVRRPGSRPGVILGRIAAGLGASLGRLTALARVILAGSPVGWLAFLALYAFSDSVGKLPFLPGAGRYVGLTHQPGDWAEALVLPWLLLGASLAAVMASRVSATVAAAAGSGQQRVARAAGVPERILSRQLRRALAAPLLELTRTGLPVLLSVAVVVEATFSIPGDGNLAVHDFARGQATPVMDMTVLAALAVVLAGLLIGLVRLLLDPRVTRS